MILRSMNRLLFGALLLGLLLALPSSASAQYFGRNKVQYEEFDWQVVETDHFDVYWYDRMAEGTQDDAGRMMERWYRRLSEAFEHEFEERKPLILYANSPDFQQTNTSPQLISEATGGFTEGLKNRIVLPFAETYAETDHVLGHELVHGFQFDMAFRARTGGNAAGAFRLPLWVTEGLAEYLTLGSTYPHTAMWLRDAVLRDDFPTLEDLSRDPRYFPYRFGHAFWAYVAGVYGDRRVIALYQSMGQLGVSGGLQEALLSTPDSFSGSWREEVFDEYGPILADRTAPDDLGERLIRDGTGWALAPVLSPDGRHVAFLSQRDLFTIDLFLADATTGEVLGKLASQDRNAHFDALAFINAAGSWSPDGERFAFVTVTKGDNGIAIADVDSRSVVETRRLPGVGAIHSLAWSPDGNRIVASGNAGGVSDLYLFDLATGETEQLTDDKFAELHPAWSPDGGTLVFATDRDGARALRDLDMPRMGLGFMDVASREIRVERPLGEGSKHINPQYGPNGESLWFIGDPDGVADIYRLGLADDTVHRVTKVATGISGITQLAPAMSVGADGGLAFSVFSGGDYIGRTIGPEAALGEPFETDEAFETLALLPPAERPDRDAVDKYTTDARTGLPNERGFSRHEYDPGLSLDFVAPPTAGVGVDRFGTALGGSLGMFFSDMLGNRQVGLGIWANGGVQDIGGQLVYQNLESRWNWGGSVGRIPFRTGFTQVGIDPETGAQTVQIILERVAVSGASFLAEYPFSRTRRIESEIGFSRYDFSREALQSAFVGGISLGSRTVDLPAPDPLNLGQASLAYVEDFSFFGFTSPVRGGRARLEVSGNTGTINWVSVLADWRRYWFAKPVTFAVRGLHFGRYGGDADSGRLSDLFVGFPTLIRGYDSDSFEPDECTSEPGSGDEFSCPEFDRLVGTRIAVANVELRLPLVGTEEFGLLSGGFLPTELALFTDMGMAWSDEEGVEFDFATDSTERIPVFSSGASLRINLFGALVGELYYVVPWQRPDENGFFAFQIQPGW